MPQSAALPASSPGTAACRMRYRAGRSPPRNCRDKERYNFMSFTNTEVP